MTSSGQRTLRFTYWSRAGMPYYHPCPLCGANLDPGEHCDCQNKTKEDKYHDGNDNQN